MQICLNARVRCCSMRKERVHMFNEKSVFIEPATTLSGLLDNDIEPY